MGKRAPGDVLHAGLVVDDHVAVVPRVLFQLRLEDAVDKAVTALSLGAAHHQHVEVVLLDQRRAEAELGVVRLCHAAGDRVAPLFRLGHLLADIAQGGLHLHAQDLVQIGIGVGVHHEDRRFSAAAQIVHDHAADRGFPDAAFSGDRNGMGHFDSS